MVRSRSSDKSKRIAVAIELNEPYPHHLGCYQGIQQYAKEHTDWTTVVDPHIVGMDGTTGGAGYDGIVGRISSHVAKAAEKVGIPAVNIWVNSPVKGLPGVYYDVQDGGRMGGEHLVARGFQHFAFIGFNRDRYGSAELAGFVNALKEHGFKSPKRFMTSFSYEERTAPFARFRKELYQWITELPKPVGIYATVTNLAQYVVQLCSELDFRVPHDVGIVTEFNPTVSLWTEPTLSSIDDDNEGVGYHAAELLDKLMKSKKAKPPKTPILVKPKGLTVRASSDAFVVADPLVAKALSVIAERARDAVTVMDVAEAVNTTTRTLARRFERTLGRPIFSEISRMRVEYIKRRLQDTNTPLGVLAKECGFTSASHFALYFRKMTGLRPREYRRQHTK